MGLISLKVVNGWMLWRRGIAFALGVCLVSEVVRERRAVIFI
jgi:hypothetical protein